jgi:hypothetical protein
MPKIARKLALSGLFVLNESRLEELALSFSSSRYTGNESPSCHARTVGRIYLPKKLPLQNARLRDPTAFSCKVKSFIGALRSW